MHQSVKLSEIRIDGGTQARAELNEAVVSEYAEAIADGAQFPPAVLFFDGSAYWLADGFHRFHAFRKAGKGDLPADVRQGTRRDAILYSVGANANHGLRRSNSDKRKAVLTLLADPGWSKWPDREIARVAAVGRHFVRKLREEVTCTPSTSEPVYRKYINKHGKEAVMNVSRIGSTQAKTRRELTNDELQVLQGAPNPSVYVLGDGSRFKIGWSRYPAQRVRDLLSLNPTATLVAIADGGAKEERAIHDRLHCERDVGEWFIVDVEAIFAAMSELGIGYTTKHGTVAQMDTSRIGKASPAEPKAEAPVRAVMPAARREPETDAGGELTEADRIAELEEANRFLEGEVERLNVKVKTFEHLETMYRDWSEGGWEKVVQAKDDLIAELQRTAQARIARESSEKVRNLNAMRHLSKKLEEEGKGRDLYIDIEDAAHG